jgi:hypothetical protein
MYGWAFEVAGVHLQFAGDSSDIETLKRLFARFHSPRGLCPDVSVELKADQCSWKTAKSSGSIRLLDPRAATAAATMLLARLLSEVRPDFVVLHGNGLRGPDGRGVLLLGDSGAGKTTLTRTLLGGGFGMTQVAEDVLVVDPEAGRLHPFPRALAIRTGEEASAEEATFGFAEEARGGRPLEEFSATAEAMELAGSCVFLLGFAGGEAIGERTSKSAASGERAWLSWADGRTLDALRRVGLPVSALTIGKSVAVVDYERGLENSERALQHRLLEELEILHLHSAPLPAGAKGSENPVEPMRGAGERRRPEAPQCEALGPGDGVRGCLAHLRRVEGVGSKGEASRVFLRLARGLSSSRFFRLVPGGSPQETAGLLLEKAAGEVTSV